MSESVEEPDLLQLVAFYAGAGRYGAPIQDVLEMTILSRTDAIAGAPPSVLGMMRVRQEIVPVLDLRVRLGMPSRIAETQEHLDALEAFRREHLEWFESLTECVEAGRRFTMAADLEQCRFHAWVSEQSARDTSLERWLHRFPEPHGRF